jgi:hypothetical protein
MNPTTQFLKQLGYSENDKTYFRAIGANGQARKIEGSFQRKQKELESLNEKGYGIYVVVNGGGHSDAAITQGHALFYEHDDLEKADQINLWQALGLPEPTMQVDTGGKSIHSYWVLDCPCQISEWKTLQADLLEFADADRSIKNPSRVMRLAGFKHQKTGEVSTIISNSGQRYSLETLQQLIPTSKPMETPTVIEPGALPLLYKCLSKSHRDLIDRGEGNGNRNNAGAALARDLVGTSDYLSSIGTRFEGDARALFDDFCGRCNPQIDSKEADSIWFKAEQSNPTPCLSPDKIANCIRFQSLPMSRGQGFGNNVVAMRPSVPTVPLENLPDKIAALLDRNIAGAELETEKIKLREQFGLKERDFDRLWQQVTSEYEGDDVADRATVERLLASKRSSISLGAVLPNQIAKILGQMAADQNLRPELYLMSMLSAVGSLAQNGTSLTLSKQLGFSVTPNIFVAIVAPPSQKKSPVLSRVVGKPFWSLTEAAKKRFNAAMDRWESAKAAAAENDEPFDDPEPVQDLYFFTKTTGEAILNQVERVPHRGLLGLSDELAGYFKSGNQYRGGRGSDAEDLLSYYDGSGGLTLRVDGVRNCVQTINFGLLGAIQPKVLQSFLSTCEDANGGWARWFFVVQPVAASEMPEFDDPKIDDITEVFAEYYTRIADAPAQNYTLTPDAYQTFRTAYNELEQRRVNEPNPAMQAAIGKMAGRIGKMALNLHLVECSVSGRFEGRTEIDKSTIEKAIAITEMGLEQLRAIYCDAGSEEGLSPTYARIIETSRNKGAITARDISRMFSGNNAITAPEARKLMLRLQSEGFGEVTGSGKAIEFTAYLERSEVIADVPTPSQEVEEWGDAWLNTDSYASDGFLFNEVVTVADLYDVENPNTGQTERAAQVLRISDDRRVNVWAKHLSSTPLPDDLLGDWEVPA